MNNPPQLYCPKCDTIMELLPSREDGPHIYSHICTTCGPTGKQVLAGKMPYKVGFNLWVFYFPPT